MATLDATQVPTSSLSKPQTSEVEWDIDGADEIPATPVPAEGSPAAGLGATAPTSEKQAPALADAPELTQANPDSEWDIDSPTVKLPSVETDQEEEPTDLGDIQAEAEEDTANAMWQTEDAELPTEQSAEQSELPASEDDPEAGSETSDGPQDPPQEPGEVEAATEDDLLAEIVEAERKCERASAVVEGLKSRMKEAKEDLAAAVNRLRRLAREIGEDHDRPLPKQQPTKAVEQPQQQSDQEAESEVLSQVRSLENGDTPIRVKCLIDSEEYPELIKGSDHDVIQFYVGEEAEEENLPDFTVSIQDPGDDDGELFLPPNEYEVLEWLGGDDSEAPGAPAEGERKCQDMGTVSVEIKSHPANTSAPTAAAGQEDDSWREQRLLEDIGLAPNLCTLLADNPDKTIKTLGHLVDWQSKGNDLTDIPKVGPAKVDKINEALDRFWKRWGAK